MPTVTVKIIHNGNIAKVVGWILATKRKKEPAGGGAPAPKRKNFVFDYDVAELNPSSNTWVLTLQKAAGPRVRRNVLFVTAFDRRGRIIDRLVRKCKR